VLFEPPATGAGGRSESPISTVTSSGLSPSFSAAMIGTDGEDALPNLMGRDLHLRTPFGIKRHARRAGAIFEGYRVVAVPQPISQSPSRIAPGFRSRFDQPNASAPASKHCTSERLE